MSEYRITINSKVYGCISGQSILEASEQNGVPIPRICHDHTPGIPENCGLCAVEVEGVDGLVKACGTPVFDGMILSTNSPKVREHRRQALQTLLMGYAGDCIAPCQARCPAGTDCQGFIELLAVGAPQKALERLKDAHPLPASLSRICPHPCERACRRGLKEGPVAISALKRYVADRDLASKSPFLPEIAPDTGKTVAIVGAGPAGLTAAWFLTKLGHKTTIFDKMHKAGGMLRYGIPQYRLPKLILDEEVALVEKLGVSFQLGRTLGEDFKLEDLRKRYNAVYLAVGAWNNSTLSCPGAHLPGVLGGTDFLRQVALGKPPALGRRVTVVGGGKTALDASRTALRLGAEEVRLVYRGTRGGLSAGEMELRQAEEEGIRFRFLEEPLEILGGTDGVTSIRLRFLEKEGAEETLETDSVICATGRTVSFQGLEHLERTERGTLRADGRTFLTNLPGVFAGGDAVNAGPGIAVEAIGQAKRAAVVIDSFLRGALVPYEAPFVATRAHVTEEELPPCPPAPRHSLHDIAPADRAGSFEPVCWGFTEDEAQAEAARCLSCGCAGQTTCRLLAYAQEYGVPPQGPGVPARETD